MAETATTPKPAVAAATAVKQTARAVEQQSRKVADTAHELQKSSGRIETSAEITTRLAADRNILAAERTYAAWVRTGLFALASGIGAHALLNGVVPGWLVMADASMLIAFSIFCFGAAIWRHLNPGPPPPVPQLVPIPRAVLITMNLFLALVSLAALIGIWFAPPVAAVARIAPG
jgi:putative membrane protein